MLTLKGADRAFICDHIWSRDAPWSQIQGVKRAQPPANGAASEYGDRRAVRNAPVSTQTLSLKLAVPTDGGTDRRRHPRVRLSYLLRLFRPGDSAGIETQTEDLSCDGFDCILDQPILPHERIECELLIPGEWAGDPRQSDLVLRCRAEVVRVVPDPVRPMFRAACRIEGYTVNRNIAGRTAAPVH
jgi:PilZ domain-containing protein